MIPPRVRGQTSNIAFVFIGDNTSTTGAGKTGLTNASAGLNISIRRELSATFTASNGANIGTIVTLGTWVNPGAGKINFKECDATNAPGLYEVHFPDVGFGTGDTSRCLVGMVTGTGLVPAPFECPLWGMDPQDGVHGGMTALPNAAAGANGGLPTADASNQVKANVTAWAGDAAGIAVDTNHLPKVDVEDWHAQAVSVDANNVPNVSAKYWAGTLIVSSSIPVGTAAGAAGGLFIAGSNAATTVNITGTITTVTNLTNLPAIPANWLTAAGIAAGALNGKGDWNTVIPPTVAAISTGVWTDLTTGGDFGTANSIGLLLVNDLNLALSAINTNVLSRMATFTLPTNFSSLGISGGGHILTVDAATVSGYAAGQDPATLLFAGAIEGSLTFQQAVRIMLAANAGKTNGAPAGPFHARDQADSKNRITATVDANGNRTAMTVDGT